MLRLNLGAASRGMRGGWSVGVQLPSPRTCTLLHTNARDNFSNLNYLSKKGKQKTLSGWEGCTLGSRDDEKVKGVFVFPTSALREVSNITFLLEGLFMAITWRVPELQSVHHKAFYQASWPPVATSHSSTLSVLERINVGP